MEGIKLVALDVDGVLRDASRLFYECHKRALELEGLGKEFERAFDVRYLWHFKGLETCSDKKDALAAIYALIKGGKLDGLHDIIYMPDAGRRISGLLGIGGADVKESILHEMVKEYERTAKAPQSAKLVRLYPGIDRHISGIKSSGMALGLFTNSSAITVKRDLGRLLERFDYVVTPDDVSMLKPSGEGLRLISKMSGVPAEELAYVGDTVVDIRASKDAGCKAFAVYCGMGLREHLERERPDMLFKDLEAVSRWAQRA